VFPIGYSLIFFSFFFFFFFFFSYIRSNAHPTEHWRNSDQRFIQIGIY